MAKSALSTASHERAVMTAADPTPATRPGSAWSVKKILSPLSSLRLTVVLFAFSIVLVLAGTVAQIDAGVWTVVNQYFRSLFVWIPLQIFFPRTMKVPGVIPYPGGWLLGGLLLVNLLAAHAVRFKVSWKRSGILLIHSGLIVMMVSELVTGLYAVESKMVIETRDEVNYVDVSNKVELALIDSSNPKQDDVVVIPGSILRRGGTITHELLPVDVEVVEFMENSDVLTVREGNGGGKDEFTSLAGMRVRIVGRAEGSGVDANQREDAPSVRVTFRKKGTGEALGTHLLSLWFYSNFTQRLPQYQFPPQRISLDGKTYTAELRLQRIYKPYAIQLKEFHHDVYAGTTTPKNFASDVRLVDLPRGEDREVKIYMNHPLRYSGETFFQSGFLAGDRGTILQVVRNPGWQMPYVSCALVAVGMLIHFGIQLVRFLRRRVIA